MKNNFLGIRVSDEDKKDMVATQQELGFNNLSSFVIFLWNKFKSERKKP